jgi:hypothetical protein
LIPLIDSVYFYFDGSDRFGDMVCKYLGFRGLKEEVEGEHNRKSQYGSQPKRVA